MPKQKILVKNVPDGVDGAPPWITTFVDMVSLLVTFFILLYTFSSIREFDTFTYPKNIMSTSGVIDSSASDTMEAPHDDLMLGMDLARGSRKRHTRPVNELRENIEEMGQSLTEAHIPIDLRGAGDGVLVRFSEDAGFEPGEDEVGPALEKALTELGDTAGYYPLMVVVEGHTDDAFVPSPSSPDAYAMSIARARAAADVLVERGGFDPTLVLIEGYGSDRPRVDPESALDRRANRRVEVRLVSISRDRVAAMQPGEAPMGGGR